MLCRNVTIYFSRDTTRALMGRLHGALRDGGYLFLGHSETLWQVSEEFRLVALGTGDAAAYVYRRLDEPAADRRAVLPDRRTLQELPLAVERRTADRRAPDCSAASRAPSSPSRHRRCPRPPSPPCATALAQGRYEEAARLARLAGDAEPLRAEVHYLLGLALVDQGLDAEALPALRRAVYLDPEDGLAHFLLAGALARCGDRAAAAREYRAAAQDAHPGPAPTTTPPSWAGAARASWPRCAPRSRASCREERA